jgi:hypothetical protein
LKNLNSIIEQKIIAKLPQINNPFCVFCLVPTRNGDEKAGVPVFLK